jgi:hypothetical protein
MSGLACVFVFCCIPLRCDLADVDCDMLSLYPYVSCYCYVPPGFSIVIESIDVLSLTGCAALARVI